MFSNHLSSSRRALAAAFALAGVAAVFAGGRAAADQSPETAADAHFKAQRWDNAAEAYRELSESAPDNEQHWFRLGYALHALGRYEEALGAHVRAAGFGGTRAPAASYNAACALARLGRSREACERLGLAVKAGFGGVGMLDADPDLASVRDLPEFAALRRRVMDATRYRSLPRPHEPGDAQQFDFWVGEWESINRAPAPGGGWQAAGGLATRVEKVLGGEALIEWSEATVPGGPSIGFSLRTFDAAADEWRVLLNWPSPGRPSFSVLTGRFRHGRCSLMSGPYGKGGASQTRFTFADVSDTGYRWDSAVTSDRGTSWATNLVFEARRRPAGSKPLKVGPSRSTSHGSGPEFRALDWLLGTWSGTRTTSSDGGEGRTVPIALVVTSVMEGSAVLERRVVGEGDASHTELAIQCLEPARGHWVRYALRQGEARFERHSGTPAASSVAWTGTPGPGSAGSDLAITVTGRDGELRVACAPPASNDSHSVTRGGFAERLKRDR